MLERSIYLTIIFGVAFLIILKQSLNNGKTFTNNKKLLLLIPFFASISNLLIYLEFTKTQSILGEDYLIRYFYWLTTTMIITYLTSFEINKYVKNKLLIIDTLLSNFIMILSGLVAIFSPDFPTQIIFLSLGGISFIYLSYLWIRSINIIKSKDALFIKLLVYTNIILWGMYPINILIGAPFLHLIPYEITSLVFTSLDLSSKLIFLFILSRSQSFIEETNELEELLDEDE